MKIELTEKDKQVLEVRHRKERDGRVRDRIKAVLLKSEEWTISHIAQALRIHEETVREHLSDYAKEQKLKPCNGGSESKLNKQNTQELIAHLEEHTYTKVREICTYVSNTYGVVYSLSGMCQWLHEHKFSYKKPKPTPAKANPQQQQDFLTYYRELINKAGESEPILFLDAAHPTMATKITYGWIRQGADKPIATQASRTRMNILGAIELKTMHVATDYFDTIDSQSVMTFLTMLKLTYAEAPQIHIILDQSGYHRNQQVLEFARRNGICLHFLPPYSPNLNSIERLWKVMNEHVRNNRYFSSAKQFKDDIKHFFSVTLPSLAEFLRSCINDNFQIIKPAPST
jgi:transposase